MLKKEQWLVLILVYTTVVLGVDHEYVSKELKVCLCVNPSYAEMKVLMSYVFSA